MAPTLSSPLTELYGVGKARANQLDKLGIHTIEELLFYFPRAYEKRGDVKQIRDCELDETVSLILTVGTAVSSATIKRGMSIQKLRAFDESGALEVIFFNSPFVKQVFTVGASFRFYGKLTHNKGRLRMTSPKYEPYLPTHPLPDYSPVYPLTSGLSSKVIGGLIRQALDALGSTIEDYLPEQIRLSEGFPTLSYAIENAHFPKDEKALVSSVRRLTFNEMLLFALAVCRGSVENKLGRAVTVSPCSVKPFLTLLPYELTGAQKRAVNEIYGDMTRIVDGRTPPMTRILVGDVGSGKTVCAALAIYIAIQSGYQCALMAPTEILACQHYEELSAQFSALGYRTELLLGSTKQKEKTRIYDAIREGQTNVLIGTHAILSDKVSFQNLGLVITDEQHRFGVAQRAVLKNKSERAHLLVMSATPIPRTLALSLYGDLDVSKIDEMPKGRMRVDTHLVNESYRSRLDGFILRQVSEGGQCYVVCPSIESEEDVANTYYLDGTEGAFVSENSLKLKNATDYAKDLAARLPSLRVSLLHGKMTAAEKDGVMHAFALGEIDVLVSTTVIEVGVNVPNACLMIVENADRFGLSQLHQLRGRVGRGKRKSYCILVSDASGEVARERLHTMCTVFDGYQIAEKDLILRGPGDFFSNQGDSFRQSGGFQFRFAKLCNDSELFSKSFDIAKHLLSEDPSLAKTEHIPLLKKLDEISSHNSSVIS